MRGRVAVGAGVAVATALACAAAAVAITTQIGNLKVSATAEFSPREFPRHGMAPARFASIIRIGAVDRGQPPTLATMTFDFDKHGKLNFRGVPTCTIAKLEGTTPAEARKRCAGALLGTGTGKARVEPPGGGHFTISSPISIFNAPPDHGQAAMIAHAYETVPTPQALLVPFTIERIHHGRYGYRTELRLPPIAGGEGAAILAETKFGRTYRRHGHKVGYAEAECSGGRLQVYGWLTFAEGSHLQSLLSSPCHTD